MPLTYVCVYVDVCVCVQKKDEDPMGLYVQAPDGNEVCVCRCVCV